MQYPLKILTEIICIVAMSYLFAGARSTHLIRNENAALEKLLENQAGKYATGDEPFLADLFLAPQIDGAVKRFNVDMNEFPLLSKINESYNEHPAFQDAMPGKQPDTPPEARVD
ncbi:UNVERIFIED_CONTAM: Glutathione S-transferase Z1 [Sesamum latifolium]|uniref:Glutathione S-transferase Z1 n=1 Tax=Sesamum latifolium TaxID=2727402 RepID=A0AAW2XLB6_9LAMI